MRPYLEELQDLWPVLLLAGFCGGVVSVAIAAALLIAKKRYTGLPQLHEWSWKVVLPERLPLLWSRDKEESNHCNYQTTV